MRGFNPNLVRLRHDSSESMKESQKEAFQSQLGSIKTEKNKPSRLTINLFQSQLGSIKTYFCILLTFMC
ncbi:hypothetical protein THTE_4322 [Thermogutta terrifontis]|uniref:Uncharacterized protein n=1 Tax=Thermogutta terrifontis TaxID=1331910 RepID=A0A286RLS1_9BACT|nr:hypothetical protein THTE_4322 [Thermogutta terrifontis]